MLRCSTCAWHRNRRDERVECVYCAHSGRAITALDVADMDAGRECPMWRSADEEQKWHPKELT